MALSDFKPEKYLQDREAQIAFLDEAVKSGNADEIKQSLVIVARARGIEDLARETGLSKQGIYKALGENGDPKLSTVLKIINALGMSLELVHS